MSDRKRVRDQGTHEVEVLRNDRRGRAREVERERVLDRAEIVQLEDEVLREVGLVAPDNPADATVRKSELVTGRVDRHDARELEVPQELRVRERRDEAARRAVDVDRDGVTSTGLELVQELSGLLVPATAGAA
jgi:hypothetical protein